jgi:hypothetical protein
MIAIKDTLNEEEEEAVGAIARGGMQRPHRVGAVDLITGSCRVPGSGAAPTTAPAPGPHPRAPVAEARANVCKTTATSASSRRVFVL